MYTQNTSEIATFAIAQNGTSNGDVTYATWLPVQYK